MRADPATAFWGEKDCREGDARSSVEDSSFSGDALLSEPALCDGRNVPDSILARLPFPMGESKTTSCFEPYRDTPAEENTTPQRDESGFMPSPWTVL